MTLGSVPLPYYKGSITVITNGGNYMTTVSLRVKRLINERGLSQKELSILTGIRESTISEICRGSKTVINFDHIARIDRKSVV